MIAKRVAPPALWVPTAFFAEGIPYAMVIWVAGTMCKDLGYSTADHAFHREHRHRLVAEAVLGGLPGHVPDQAVLGPGHAVLHGALLAGSALALHLPSYFHIVVATLWVLAFASATHDICHRRRVHHHARCESKQAAWIGVQGMSWNVGRIFADGRDRLVREHVKERGP